MAEDKKQKKNQEGQQINDPVQGRIHNSQNPEWEQQGAHRDISSIDQQEGNMEHGERGANLNEKREQD